MKNLSDLVEELYSAIEMYCITSQIKINFELGEMIAQEVSDFFEEDFDFKPPKEWYNRAYNRIFNKLTHFIETEL